MVRDNFLQRKQDVLSKLDKSSIGDWDFQIKGLCDKINKSDDFYQHTAPCDEKNRMKPYRQKISFCHVNNTSKSKEKNLPSSRQAIVMLAPSMKYIAKPSTNT